jgi:hypothetical protein
MKQRNKPFAEFYKFQDNLDNARRRYDAEQTPVRLRR